MLLGEGAHATGFVLPPQHAGGGLAGEHAVLVLEFGADDVGDAEVVGDRLDLHPGRRRRDGDGVALAQVSADDVAGLGADGAGDLGVEDALPELRDLVDRAALQAGEADLAHDLRVAAEHAAVDGRDQGLGELQRPDVAAAEAIGIQGGGGVALDDRAVEVEERPDTWAVGRRLDLGDQLGRGDVHGQSSS